jgi:DNA-binding transcriptional MerR regulator
LSLGESVVATRSVTLPPKLYFRIGEVAELVGVQPHVLRYWEREFRTIRPTKSAKGQRVYSRRDVENLLRVRDLLYRERFTIAGARQRLGRTEPLDAGDEADAAVPPPVDVEGATASDEADRESDAPLAPCASATEDTVPQPDATLRTTLRDDLLAIRADIHAFLAELDPPLTR